MSQLSHEGSVEVVYEMEEVELKVPGKRSNVNSEPTRATGGS